MNKVEGIFTEAYMKWQSEHEGGDIAGKPYFEGGCDAMIMLAQMFGASEDFIKKMIANEDAELEKGEHIKG